VLVCLFSTVSPLSKQFLPELERIRRRFEGKLVVVALTEQSYDRDARPGRPWADTVPRYFRGYPELRFHVGLDGPARVQRAVGTEALPHVLLMGADGVVRWQGYPYDEQDPISLKVVRAFLKREVRRVREEAEREGKDPKDGDDGDDR
jgi:hypothetical protein